MLSVNRFKQLLASNKDQAIKNELEERFRSGRLSLRNLNLTALPTQLFEFADRLQTLDLSNNKLKDLPEEMALLTKVTQIDLAGNPWRARKVPPVLFAMPALLQVAGIPRYIRRSRHLLLEKFLRLTQHLKPEERHSLFAALNGDVLDHLPQEHLFLGLMGNFNEVCQPCFDALIGRSASQPLDSNASVTIVGSVRFKKTEIKAALVEANIGYSPKPCDATTHVVLGRSPKKITIPHTKPLTFLSPSSLQPLLNASQAGERFLMVDTSEATAHSTNLQAMLSSGEPPSIDLALGLIKSGGVPKGAMTALFVLAKTGKNPKQRTLARKLVKRYGSEPVLKALAKRNALGYQGDKAERRTYESLCDYATIAPELDWIWVGRQMRQQVGHGLRYVLDHGSDAVRIEVLREHIKDGALDFHDLYSPRSIPFYTNYYAAYSGLERAIPTYLYQLTELTELSLQWCRFNVMPEGIDVLRNLRSLNLSGNMFRVFPKHLLKMTWLSEINIGDNEFTKFPAEMAVMTGLRHVNIQGNRRGAVYQSIETPAQVRQKMPKCHFIDGLTRGQHQHNNWFR